MSRAIRNSRALAALFAAGLLFADWQLAGEQVHAFSSTSSIEATKNETAGQAHSAVSDQVPALADTIYALGSERGFSGLAINHPEGTIHVYWKGSVPDDIRRVAGSQASGIDVQFHTDGSYTRHEAMAAPSRVAESDLAEQTGIQTVSVNHRGDGLEVSFANEAPGSETLSKLADIAGIHPEHLHTVEYAGEFVFTSGS